MGSNLNPKWRNSLAVVSLLLLGKQHGNLPMCFKTPEKHVIRLWIKSFSNAHGCKLPTSGWQTSRVDPKIQGASRWNTKKSRTFKQAWMIQVGRLYHCWSLITDLFSEDLHALSSPHHLIFAEGKWKLRFWRCLCWNSTKHHQPPQQNGLWMFGALLSATLKKHPTNQAKRPVKSINGKMRAFWLTDSDKQLLGKNNHPMSYDISFTRLKRMMLYHDTSIMRLNICSSASTCFLTWLKKGE